jgi:hypothetical protein
MDWAEKIVVGGQNREIVVVVAPRRKIVVAGRKRKIVVVDSTG